ncbi:hypothetical protein [Moorena sp. SIOASIH]|uniref:hypothetical protein n=1 Tax=Moorena sp. SIOASIH TaxID=2607817 RepID=UPI00344BA72D
MLNQGRLLMPELELSLRLCHGSFRDIPRLWLRWMTLEGNLIPLASEELVQAQLEAIEAKQRAERLAARLRELGINPDQLD